MHKSDFLSVRCVSKYILNQATSLLNDCLKDKYTFKAHGRSWDSIGHLFNNKSQALPLFILYDKKCGYFFFFI